MINPFQESVDPVKYWKREAELHEEQCAFNARVATHYADKLEEIARMCGWTIPAGSCVGIPEDIEDIAVKSVRFKLHRLERWKKIASSLVDEIRESRP